MNSPELAVIFNCDAKVSSLSVANLCPLFRADEQRAKPFKKVLMTSHSPNKLDCATKIQSNQNSFSFLFYLHIISSALSTKSGCVDYILANQTFGAH